MKHKMAGRGDGEEVRKPELVGLAEGIRRSVGLAAQVRHRPILIGAFGLPNSGKSYIISKMVEELHSNGILSTGYHCTASSSSIRLMAEMMRKDPGCLPAAFLYHCAYERSDILDSDTESLLKLIVGRGMDVAIGIYNPLMSEVPEGKYDVLISNPCSRRKDAR